MEQEKLSNDFKSVLQKFQTSSQVAIAKERETVSRARAASVGAAGGGGGGGGGGGYDERARLIEEEQRNQLDMMDAQVDYSSSVIAERETAIKDIESTMMEVNDIYKDLSTLVVEQGAQLDNIEANMSAADSSVESGVTQLSKASRYQKKSRNKMCILLLIVMVVLGIVLAATLSK